MKMRSNYILWRRNMVNYDVCWKMMESKLLREFNA